MINRIQHSIAFGIGCAGFLLLGAIPAKSQTPPDGMVLVPGGEFTLHTEYRWREGLTLGTLIIDDAGIRYRKIQTVDVPAFFIDKTEVTNNQFKNFLDATGYTPKWPRNFLRHWKNGRPAPGQGDHPVVWVSLQDAQAYAEWAGKRLPTEAEWQKAAQGTDGRIWPWGNLFDPEKANIDSKSTKPVGSYPEGASPYGCLDMVGNVWEWTDSYQTDGYHNFSWLRGGSFYLAKGSLWYMQGGSITVYQRTKFWYMTPALNRSPTIGFRCVKDVD